MNNKRKEPDDGQEPNPKDPKKAKSNVTTSESFKSTFEPKLAEIKSEPFLKDFKTTFSNSIPFYCSYPENVLVQVKDFIMAEPREATFLTIFDSPGVGKTTTIQTAAADTGAFYIRVTPSNSILSQYRAAFTACQLTPGLSEQSFMHSMESLVLSTYASIWKNLNEGPLDTKNEFEVLPNAVTEEARAQQILLEAIKQRTGKRILVLHFDEVQNLGEFQVDWERCHHRRPVVASDVPNYLLICLTAAWAKIYGLNIHLALTGTSTKLGARIRGDSEVKVQSATIGTFTAHMVHQTVQHFFHLNESQIIHALEGPPRITEYFLVALKNCSTMLLTTDTAEITNSLQQAFDNATTKYFQYLDVNILDRQAIYRVLYYVNYAELLGGVRTDDGIQFPVHKIDSKLYKDAETGIIRLYEAGPTIIIQHLHPLLLRYLCSELASIFSNHAIELFIHQIEAKQAQNPAQQFEFAFTSGAEKIIIGKEDLKETCQQMADTENEAVIEPILQHLKNRYLKNTQAIQLVPPGNQTKYSVFLANIKIGFVLAEATWTFSDLRKELDELYYEQLPAKYVFMVDEVKVTDAMEKSQRYTLVACGVTRIDVNPAN